LKLKSLINRNEFSKEDIDGLLSFYKQPVPWPTVFCHKNTNLFYT